MAEGKFTDTQWAHIKGTLGDTFESIIGTFPLDDQNQIIEGLKSSVITFIIQEDPDGYNKYKVEGRAIYINLSYIDSEAIINDSFVAAFLGNDTVK